VKILPISEKQLDYAEKVYKELKDSVIRVELDSSNESLGKKIRNAKMEKIPYLIVIGDKEKESETLTVEGREGEKLENSTSVNFLKQLKDKIENKN